MKFLTAVAGTAAMTITAVAGPSLAQDYRQSPTYGTRVVNTGFTPDPITVNLQSGGDINATRLGGECRGMIARAPDYRVRYTAGTTFPLIISVASDADTTLVINGPDGRWYCNDDANGLNPMVRFNRPRSGQYDIWVGTYGNSGLHNAQLGISELRAIDSEASDK